MRDEIAEAKMGNWEYRIVTEHDSLSVEPMTKLGHDRWELVAVTTHVESRDT